MSFRNEAHRFSKAGQDGEPSPVLITGQKIRNTITGENRPIDYNTDAMFYSKAASAIRGTVAQNIVDVTGYIDLNEEDHPILSRLLNGKSLADVYQFGMGMLDSTAVVALAAINPVLGKAGVALLSTSSGTDAMLDAVSRGASDEQALTMGILTAGFEMMFEKYELDRLLGQGTNVWQACWRQGLSGIVGGGVPEVANILADIAVMAEKSDWQKNIQRYLGENPDWDYRQAQKQAFIDAALQVGEASLVGGISGSIMGSVYAANTRVNQADVAKRLMDKGFNPEKSAKMADAIAARLNGQELTTIQKDRLRSAMDNAVVRDVMSDITKKKADGIDSAQHNGYDEISTIGGNAVTEDLALHQDQNAPSEGSYEGNLEPGTLSNVDSRKWYLEQEAKIPSLIDASLPLEQQAKQAFDLRNQYRTKARELMSDRQLAASLYSTDPNLTWEQIVQKQIDKGLSGDDIYKAIIESSQRSRISVNQSLGLE